MALQLLRLALRHRWGTGYSAARLDTARPALSLDESNAALNLRKTVLEYATVLTSLFS